MKRFLSWTQGTKRAKGRGRQRVERSRRPSRLSFEGLEDRRMMAITVFYDDGFRSGDYDYPQLVGIHIIGTANGDTIDVKTANGRITVTGTEGNGRVKKFSMSAAMVPQIFFYGLDGDDAFTSNSAATTYISGGPGNDTLYGGEGRYYIYGDRGNDTLSAGRGDFGEFHGGGGIDTVYGTSQVNHIYGGPDTDYLYGGGGNDYILGQLGNDFIYGGAGSDILAGGFDNDYIHGGDDPDRLYGEGGYDNLNGGEGGDWLYGSDDSDILYGGGGHTKDYLHGGASYDTFHLDAATFDTLDQPGVTAGDIIADFTPQEGDFVAYRNASFVWGEAPGVSYAVLAKPRSKFVPSQTADAPLDELAFQEPIEEVPLWSEAYVAELNAAVLTGILAEDAPSIADGDESQAALVAYLHTLDLGVTIGEGVVLPETLPLGEPIENVLQWSETYVAAMNAELLAGILAEDSPSIAEGDASHAELVEYFDALDPGATVGDSDEEALVEGDPQVFEEVDNYFAEAADEDVASDELGEEIPDEDPTTYEEVDSVFSDEGWSEDPFSANGLRGAGAFGGFGDWRG